MLYEVIRRLNFMKTRKLLILATSIALSQRPGKSPETLKGLETCIKFKALQQTFRNSNNNSGKILGIWVFGFWN